MIGGICAAGGICTAGGICAAVEVNRDTCAAARVKGDIGDAVWADGGVFSGDSDNIGDIAVSVSVNSNGN